MQKGGWVTIMADRYRGGTYVGVTADLIRRVYQHREGTGSIHVRDYNKTRLVYAERHEEIELAIAREKLVKKWKRPWKFALIEAENPDWRDLWDEWFTSNSLTTNPPSPRTRCGAPLFFSGQALRPKAAGAPCQARGDGVRMESVAELWIHSALAGSPEALSELVGKGCTTGSDINSISLVAAGAGSSAG